MLLYESNIECPHCQKAYKLTNSSGSWLQIYLNETYTDGYTLSFSSYDNGKRLIKCTNCENIFWREDAISTRKEDVETKRIGNLRLLDYQNVLKIKNYSSVEQEKYIRIQIWHIANHRKRLDDLDYKQLRLITLQEIPILPEEDFIDNLNKLIDILKSSEKPDDRLLIVYLANVKSTVVAN